MSQRPDVGFQYLVSNLITIIPVYGNVQHQKVQDGDIFFRDDATSVKRNLIQHRLEGNKIREEKYIYE